MIRKPLFTVAHVAAGGSRRGSLMKSSLFNMQSAAQPAVFDLLYLFFPHEFTADHVTFWETFRDAVVVSFHVVVEY